MVCITYKHPYHSGQCSKTIKKKKTNTSIKIRGAFLVAQWLRVCLPMQGTRVRALVWEDPTCPGATKPVSHNYWACASGACAPQRERPRQWEARAPRWRGLRSPQLEKALTQKRRPSTAKINKLKKKKIINFQLSQLSKQGQSLFNKPLFNPWLTKEYRICFYCRKSGHERRSCRKMQKDFRRNRISNQNFKLSKNRAAPGKHWESFLCFSLTPWDK